MKISEVINRLQKIQKEHGDVEVLAIENTWGEGDWASLEDSGVSFDRYNEGKKIIIDFDEEEPYIVIYDDYIE